MSTLDEVIAAVRANIAALDEARKQIESTKAKSEQAWQQAAMLGSERLAHGAQGLKSSCEQAQRQIAAAKEKLQELIARTNQLKAYEPGGGGARSSTPHGTVATQHSDDTPLPEPDGQKLVEDSQEGKPGFRAFTNRMFREDGTDPVKSVSESIQRFSGDRGVDLNPPESSTVAEVAVPTGPVIRGPEHQQVSAGDAAGAAIAVTVVLLKAGQSASDTIRRFRQNRRRRG